MNYYIVSMTYKFYRGSEASLTAYRHAVLSLFLSQYKNRKTNWWLSHKKNNSIRDQRTRTTVLVSNSHAMLLFTYFCELWDDILYATEWYEYISRIDVYFPQYFLSVRFV